MSLTDKLGTSGDAFYAALMNTHDGLSLEQSHALNARLILIMANEIADLKRLKYLMETACDGFHTPL